jgi:hypothetical protein
MPNLEEAIRERAYHLWLADGQPDGKAEVHWIIAQHEILGISVATAAGADTVVTKTARRTRSRTKQNVALAARQSIHPRSEGSANARLEHPPIMLQHILRCRSGFDIQSGEAVNDAGQ